MKPVTVSELVEPATVGRNEADCAAPAAAEAGASFGLAFAALRRLEYSNLQALDLQRLPDSDLPLSPKQITQAARRAPSQLPTTSRELRKIMT